MLSDWNIWWNCVVGLPAGTLAASTNTWCGICFRMEPPNRIYPQYKLAPAEQRARCVFRDLQLGVVLYGSSSGSQQRQPAASNNNNNDNNNSGDGNVSI